MKMDIKNTDNIIFHAVNKKTGEKFSFRLNDIYGYEGEECGVFIKGTRTALNFNSGYGSDGMNPDLEITSIEETEEK